MNNVPKLKIGLLMDSFDVPYWTYKMIEKIQDSTHSQISLIIMNETGTTKNNPILKVKNNRDYFLYKIYTRLENKTYHPDIDGFQIKNTAELLENIDYWRSAPVWTPDLIAEATQDWFRYLRDTVAP